MWMGVSREGASALKGPVFARLKTRYLAFS